MTPGTALPRLSRDLVLSPELQARADLAPPPPALLDLPEKAVQFGTGAFLRGFVEFFVDRANREGRFGGRIALVGSTGSGRAEQLNRQDGLFTLSVQGLRDGDPVREERVIASISRALSARDRWEAVLDLARAPTLELVFSNTTEVGIVLDPDDGPRADPPRSFPGKLTRFLLERGRAFDFDSARAPTVVPCELIEDNGRRLREIVLALAGRWALEAAFRCWIEDAVVFADTLVDRIVPGTPDARERERLEARLGYRDDLLTVCEPYRLLALAMPDGAALPGGLADVDPGIVRTDEVAPFRERKVRLLNGTHTLMVPLALLCGHETVREAVSDPLTGAFVERMLFRELVPTLDAAGADGFAREVLERFRNPYIRHELFDITLQATTKMRVRVLPSLLRFARDRGEAPRDVAFAFAAFLLFQRGDLQERRAQAGRPVPTDDAGGALREAWGRSRGGGGGAAGALVGDALGDVALWGTDLTRVPGFVAAVRSGLEAMLREGVDAALRTHLARSREEQAPWR